MNSFSESKVKDSKISFSHSYPIKIYSFWQGKIDSDESDGQKVFIILELTMYEVIDLYEINPNVKKINLELKNIKDITQMVNVFAKFKNLQEISLHGNKLTSIPPLDNLKFLTVLDLSNNPIKIDNFLLDRLFQIPKLEELCITANKQERKIIAENLPKLTYLNNEPLYREIMVQHTLQEELAALQRKLDQQMKKVRETYDRLTSSLENTGRSVPAAKNQQFNFLYKDVQQQMNYFYSGLQDRISREGVFAYCKNKLTIVLDNLMIRILDEVGNEAIVKIYEQIAKIKNQNFDVLLKIIFSTSYEHYINEQLEKPTNRLRKETLYQNQIFRLRKQLYEKRKQQQNIEKLVQKETNIIDKIRQASNSKSTSKTKRFSKSPSAAQLPRKSPSKTNLNRVQTLRQPLHRSPSIKKVQSVASKRQLGNNMSNKVSANTGGNRICSLQQLLTLIDEIMAEKSKFNLRSLQKRQDYETAEEFIFTYFSRRYGLKQMALDWSLSVIKAIQLYCKQSIEVQVFGKILKSTLYEEYYQQCKGFNKQILRSLRQSRADKGTINESQFKRLFFYFFSYENQQTFQKILKTFTFPLSQPQFVYFLQSYKLAFEEKHLKKFIDLFNRLDKDDDSALNSKEFKELAAKLVKDNQQLSDRQKEIRMGQLNANIDILRKNKFIFSEVFQIVHKAL